MSPGPLLIAAALSTGVVAGLIVYRLMPPPRRLRSRVHPYLLPSVVMNRNTTNGGVFAEVFGPIIHTASDWLAGLIDRTGPEQTLLRLRRAGWHSDASEADALLAHRMAQLRNVTVGGVGGFVVASVVGLPLFSQVVLAGLGLTVGVTRQKGRIDRAIEQRRERMRVEIYTVNQLLAMRIRAGGGVVHAVHAIVERGHGAVVDDLAQALRLHRAGWRGSDAFRRIAEVTPEPYCSRTYRLLASAEEKGSDLAASLLALSEDVRESRRESIKRSATKRRAAMLVPTIAVLAPVLIILVAAPLPYLITGWQ